MLEVGGGSYGIINTEGGAWDEQRRFVMRTLRELGFAKSSMEGMILEEAKSTVDWFQKNLGTPISCGSVFNTAVINSLWSIVSGERNENDSEIAKSSNQIIESAQTAQKTGLMFAPVLRYIIPEMSGWNSLKKASSALHKLCDESIARHKAKLNVDCPQDLIDHYLIEISKTTNPNSSFFGETGINNLRAVIADLFVAGNETTSATLGWILLYLSCHPKVQRKMSEEIRTVIGTSRLPSMTDKSNLPYTEAVMLEILRKSTMAPIGVPHRMLEDKIFQGYLLPKHTLLIANIDSALNDPEYWGDPENFRPERFLSEDGSKVVQNEALIPFSTGKRQCLGDSLAKMTLFLFTVCMFQRFEVLSDPKNLKPDLEPEGGFANLPKPFRIVMKELI